MLPTSQPTHTKLVQTPTRPQSTSVDVAGFIFDTSCRYGLTGGAALGAAYGTCVFPIIGTIIGAVFGACYGLVLGILLGMTLGLLAQYLVAGSSQLRYRLVLGAISALFPPAIMVGLPSLLYLGQERGLLAETGAQVFLLWPALLAGAYGWWAAGRIARRYPARGIQPPLPPPALGQNMYDPSFLRQLFDGMQSTYDQVCHGCSFGLGRRWRRQLVALMDLRPGMRVCDAMCGSGETWEHLLPRIGAGGAISAVDFCGQMVAAASQRRQALGASAIGVLEADMLGVPLPDNSFDALVCAYGVKTLHSADFARFAREARRLLRPGGVFGVVELSLPPRWWLRAPYQAYLSYGVPLIGRLFLGNPLGYRMLGRYLAAFNNCDALRQAFEAEGFAVHPHAFFGGCAAALVGMKLDRSRSIS